MKTIFSTLLFTLTAIMSLAQTKSDSSKHLTFKGVPIDGTLNEYVSKLKKKGLAHIRTDDGIALLKGDFAAYKNCIVGVYTLKQRDLVSRIGVLFPERETWSLLSSDYYSLKELLTEKYGKPSDSKERFQSYTPDDDGSKMTQVQLGACEYYANYETEKGSIQLSIEHSNVTRCFIKLVYFDKINSGSIKKEALDDL